MAKEETSKKEGAKKVRQPAAKKRDIQNAKKELRNQTLKAQVRTAVRHFEDAFSKKEETTKHLNTIFSLMDRAVKRGIFKLGKASRVKSRLSTKVHA